MDYINSLSEEAYEELYDELCRIEIEETEKDASGDGTDLSHRGEMAIAIVTEHGEALQRAKNR